jgi:hypothetical protein
MDPELPLRAYRLRDGRRLVEIDVPVATGFSVRADGRWRVDDETWIEPRVFLLLDADGAELADYGRALRTSALDDYFYVEGVHFVDRGELISTMLEYGGPGTWRSRLCGRTVVLSGLVREETPE